MKRPSTLFLSLTMLSMVALTATAQTDDVYYDPAKDKGYQNSTQQYDDVEQQNNTGNTNTPPATYDDKTDGYGAPADSYDYKDESGNTYVTNNYYYDEDDWDDYARTGTGSVHPPVGRRRRGWRGTFIGGTPAGRSPRRRFRERCRSAAAPVPPRLGPRRRTRPRRTHRARHRRRAAGSAEGRRSHPGRFSRRTRRIAAGPDRRSGLDRAVAAAGDRADRDPVAQDPVQFRVRVLPRGHQGQPGSRPAGIRPEKDRRRG